MLLCGKLNLVLSSLGLVGAFFLGAFLVSPGAAEPRKDNRDQSDRAAIRPVDRSHDDRVIEEFRGMDAVVRDFFIVKATMRVVIDRADAERGVDRTGEETDLEAVSTLRYADDTVGQVGERVSSGMVIRQGIVRNVGARSVWIQSVGTDEFMEILPGETSVIAAGSQCSVTCNPSSHYSCCNAGQGQTSCGCKANGTTNSCTAGGAGSSACSISAL